MGLSNKSSKGIGMIKNMAPPTKSTVVRKVTIKEDKRAMLKEKRKQHRETGQ